MCSSDLLGTVLGRRDEGQVDVRCHRRGQLHLRLLGGLFQALKRHRVLREVDALILLELLNEPVDDALVEVVTSQVSVTIGRLDLEDPVAELENRDVVRASTEVEDRDLLLDLLVEAVSERGRGRLVDDTQHLAAGDLAGLLIHLLYYLIRFAIEVPILGVPLLILVAFGVYWLWSHGVFEVKRRKIRKFRRPRQRVLSAQSSELLQETDPEFDEAAFLGRVKSAFIKAQDSWCAQDLAPLSTFVSDGIHERFSLQIEEQQLEGWRQGMKETTIRSAHIADVCIGEQFDSLTVRISFSADIHRLELDSGKRIGGSELPRTSFAEAWKQDEREATIALTKEIERGLRSVILDLEQWEDLPLLHFASDIIATDQVSKDAESGHRIQQLRSLAQFGREKATSNPRALSLLRRRLNEFRGRLKRLGLEVRHLDADYTFGQVSVFVSTNLFAIFVGLPAAIIGAVFWVVPWAMTHLAVKLGRIEQDIVATIKVLAACLVFPPWIAVTLWKSPLDFLPSAGVLVVLASCGLYARHFLRRRGRAWREARAFMPLPSRKKLRKHLCRERDELRIMLQR